MTETLVLVGHDSSGVRVTKRLTVDVEDTPTSHYDEAVYDTAAYV